MNTAYAIPVMNNIICTKSLMTIGVRKQLFPGGRGDWEGIFSCPPPKKKKKKNPSYITILLVDMLTYIVC